MKLENLAQRVQPKWRKEFLRFVETGDADQSFLKYLDDDAEGRQAVELAFNAQADALKGLAEALKAPGVTISAVAEPTALVSSRIAQAVKGALQLSADQGDQAVEQAASVLGASVGQEEKVRIHAMVRTFQDALAKEETAKE